MHSGSKQSILIATSGRSRHTKGVGFRGFVGTCIAPKGPQAITTSNKEVGMNLRKKVSLVFGSAAAATVIAGAAAFACTNLATLNLSSAAGKAGDTVTVTGSSFNV